MESITKYCKGCKQNKPINDFQGSKRETVKCQCCRRKDSEKQKRYALKHPELVRERYKNWASNNQDYQKNWNKENPEKVKQKYKKWRLSHLEYEAERKRVYQQKNRERLTLIRRIERLLNPAKALANKYRRRRRVREAGGSFTAQEWIDLCNKYHNKCLCCGEKKKLTPDHVVPIVKGGTNYIENIQPLCMNCNSRKATKTIDYR